MDYVATLRGVKWPKWHAICSMHNAYTLIDTLRNAKVNAQTSMVHFEFCILCNFHAVSVQYIAFVHVRFFIILVCPHAAIDSRGAVGFWQRCHLGFHGVRHRLWKHISILVVCICQEEARTSIHAVNMNFVSCSGQGHCSSWTVHQESWHQLDKCDYLFTHPQICFSWKTI